MEKTIENYLNVKDFGAMGDGNPVNSSINRTAFNAAFKSISLTGQTLYIPSGVYMIDDTISLAIKTGCKDIGIICDPGAVIKATSTFQIDSKMIGFLAPISNPPDSPNLANISFKWHGGTIDGRLLPAKVGNYAPDGMSVNGNDGHINKVDISNLKIILNDTRLGNSGDTCLGVVASDVNITNCIFQGAVDAGIYNSGDNTAKHGKRIRVSGNTFIECNVGFISKRGYQYHIVDGNFFEKCSVACAVGGGAGRGDAGAGGLLRGGHKAIISNNIVKNVGQGLSLRSSDDSMIVNNRIEDYGVNKLGVIENNCAIDIRGSNRCIVSNNITSFSGDFVPHPHAVAVRINKDSPKSLGTLLSTHNLITNNIFSTEAEINCAVEEVLNSNSDYNNVFNNVVIGFKQPYKIISKNKSIV